jgi:hypothetical protein
MTRGWGIQCGLTSLAFDDGGATSDTHLRGRGRTKRMHAEESEDGLADAVSQQDAKGQRRKNRTHQCYRIAHRIIPLRSLPGLDAKRAETRSIRFYCYKD